MKTHLITLLIAMTIVFGNAGAQNSNLSKRVDFNYPQKVATTAKTDLKTAIKNHDDDAIVNASICLALSQCMVSQDNAEEQIKQIESTIKSANSAPVTALLSLVEADLYSHYQNFLPFDRKNPEGDRPADISEWDRAQIASRIAELHDSAINVGSGCNVEVSKFPQSITVYKGNEALCPTIADFVMLKINSTSDDEQIKNRVQGWAKLSTTNVPTAIYIRTTNTRYDDTQLVALSEEYASSEWCGYPLSQISANYSNLKTLEHYAEKYPQSQFAPTIRNTISRIMSESAQVVYPATSNSKQKIKVEVKSTLVKNVTVKVYRLKGEVPNYSISPTDLTEVQSIPVKFSELTPGQEQTQTIEIGPLPYGNYIIDAEFRANGLIQRNSKFYSNDVLRISDLLIFTTTTAGNDKNTSKVFVVDAVSGKPLKDVTIMYGTSRKNRKSVGVTNAEGYFEANKSERYWAVKGNDKFSESIYTSSIYSGSEQKEVNLFTDLAIYRPGETVKYSGIAYISGNGGRKLCAGGRVVMTFEDSNREEIDTAYMAIDEFGRFEGSFVVPTDRMNGSFSLEAEVYYMGETFHRSKYLEVSEYKTPTFLVEFDEIKSSFPKDQPVTISGTVRTYSGMPVASASVLMKLSQHSFWWWMRGGNEDLRNDSITTDAEGRFSITYPADTFTSNIDEASPYRWRRPFMVYVADASCTNTAGETQVGQTNFLIGSASNIAFTEHNFDHLNTGELRLPLAYKNTDESADARCTYSIMNADSTVVAQGEFMAKNPMINVTNVKSGSYIISAKIADEDFEPTTANVVLFTYADKQSPVDKPIWLPRNNYTKIEGGKVKVYAFAKADNCHVRVFAGSRTKVMSEKWEVLRKGCNVLTFAIPQGNDEMIRLDLLSALNNEFAEEVRTIAIPDSQVKLDIDIASFRDKTVPGAKEHWAITVKGTNTESKAAVILEMINKAVFDLAENRWSFHPQYIDSNLFSTVWNRYSTNSNYVSWTKRAEKVSWINVPEINYYNQRFFDGGIRVRGRKMLSAANRSDKAFMKEEDCGLEESLVVACGMAKGVAMDESADAMMETTEEISSEEFKKVATREAEVKTALWLPSLTTDDSGNSVVEFDAPLYNGEWLVQTIAYNKALAAAYDSRTMVTSKPIMVQANAPRFLREADKTSIAASVMNSSGSTHRCKVLIEMLDPRTEKVLSQKQYDVTLQPKATEAVTVDWTADGTLPYVNLRVRAITDGFSDGEQVAIPVLEAISPVIETEQFFINADMHQFSLELPKFKSDARITFEYCANPIWYCVTALPTIMDKDARTSSLLAHNLFALAVAEGVAKSNPRIAEGIKLWSETPGDSTLVSQLAKNSDLKIGTLLASPWIGESQRQTLRMSCLNELFDATKQAKQRTEIIGKLKALQCGDGGFAWFDYPNRKSSLYVTNEVLEIIGEINHLGYCTDNAELNDMAKKAVSYIDKENVRLFHEIYKGKSDAYKYFGDYAYIRTLFKQIPVDGEAKTLFTEAVKALRTTWKNSSIENKAYSALTLNRNNYQGDAKAIMQSVREFAVTKPNRGMYWDVISDRTFGRRNNKVAVTSLLLEAFNEVDPQPAEIDQIRKWILLEKQTTDWGGSSLASDAVYSILSTGSNWLDLKTDANITINGTPISLNNADRFLGYVRQDLDTKNASGAVINVKRGYDCPPAWGAVYCQYKAPMTEIKSAKCDELSVEKEIFVYGADGSLRKASELKVGDKVQVRCIVKNGKTLEFVTITDERGACFEPVDKTSGYRLQDGEFSYLEIKDSSTNTFVLHMAKGTHVVSYDAYVTNPGSFSVGITTVQCQYAPQITAHSSGASVTVK